MSLNKTSRFRFVTLHTKTAFLFALGLAGIIFSSLFLTRYFFLYSLNELENLEIHEASSQAFHVIESLSARQEEASLDWAYWTESYDLLTKENTGFEERNLHIYDLDAIGLDFMTFFGANNQFVAGIGRSIEDPSAFNEQVVSDIGITNHLIAMKEKLDGDKTSISGLIRIDDNIWVVSVTPVRNGGSDAAFGGWMAWGQHLSSRFPFDFEGILTAENVILTAPSDIRKFGLHGLDADFHRHDEKVYRTPSDLFHFTSLIDIAGKEIAVLKTIEPRTYYQKGELVFYYLIFAIAAVTSGVAFVTFILFRNNVGKRFSYFEQDIKALISSKDVDLDDHKDEFERITKLVKKLASTSSETEGQLKNTLQKFEAIYHSQSLGMVLVIEKIIIDVNQMLLDLLGYKREELVGENIEILCSPEAGDRCSAEQLYSNLSQGLRQFEAWMSDSEGKTVYCIIEVTQFEQDSQTAVMLPKLSFMPCW